MANYNITDEDREARRQRALAMREQGKFGGPQPGSGRPRKKRISEVIAEQVDDEAQTFYDRLMQIVREGTDSNAITAARELIAISEKEADRRDRQDEKIDDMHRDQLLLLVAMQFKELSDRGLIPDFAGIIDGEASEVTDEELTGLSEIPASSS